MPRSLSEGIYEQLLDYELQERLQANPELRAILRQLEDEAAPHTYAQFVSKLIQQALSQLNAKQRLPLVNRLIELLAAQDGIEYLQKRRLLAQEKSLLTDVAHLPTGPLPRPITPLGTSSLLTGQGGDPPLEHEFRAEMETADRVDILVSFIKWSGLRLLVPAFQKLGERGVPVRVISTSYMGASDPVALEWLAGQSNVKIRLSYDTDVTRLHAKAYYFWRDSGFSTAYIGSANMSKAAMTQGLEWTLKVTAQDMPHILERFNAEFAAYWESKEFEPYNQGSFDKFRKAIGHGRQLDMQGPRFFAEITPHSFQQRILESLEAARQNGQTSNLVVAATGTGKTVVAALDYRQQKLKQQRPPTLLFVAHRQEILQQARECFRHVLLDQNFGEMLVGGEQPSEWRYVFASVQSLNNQMPWSKLGAGHFEHVIVDEAHHGAAASYRPLFEHLQPKLLLGLTATPERMDGSSILPDFGGEITSEIRLPEALAEKLLCPFHYFGVSDNMDFSDDRFWSNGRYSVAALEQALASDDNHARQRVDLIVQALERYQPEISEVCGVGFCAGVQHANFMAACFNKVGIASAAVVGTTNTIERADNLRRLTNGELRFVFTVDVLSEGVDIPQINTVLFLRPTESLTVFLQQLGRGLRHAPGKDCLTVLDFVGQTHRNYRLDMRYSALLMRQRKRLDKEVIADFPSLPPGCNIQLERVAREHILKKIKAVLGNLNQFIPETIRTWQTEHQTPLTFGRFIESTGLSPLEVLRRRSWSAWKNNAYGRAAPNDPDLAKLRETLPRIALRTDPDMLKALTNKQTYNPQGDDRRNIAMHYLLWNQRCSDLQMQSVAESAARWQENNSIVTDASEIAAWRLKHAVTPTSDIKLPFPCFLKLHAEYGSLEIKAALGLATLESTGATGVGVLHAPAHKCYIHLITFNKDARFFAPSTRYEDYAISDTKLHWESQSNTTQMSSTGQNYIHFKERGYTILFFARLDRTVDGTTAPFFYLGPAKDLISYDGNRPISMVWELEYPMPAVLLQEAKPAAC